MYPVFFPPISEAITSDGGISASYVITGVFCICSGLISLLLGFLLSSINAIKDDVKKIQQDFHAFTQQQTGFNFKLEEKTKHL